MARESLASEINKTIARHMPSKLQISNSINADQLLGGVISTRNWEESLYNTPDDNYIKMYKQHLFFKEGDIIKGSMGHIQLTLAEATALGVDYAFTMPGITLGGISPSGDNIAYITKDTSSLNLFYVGDYSAGEITGLSISKDKISTNVGEITFNDKDLVNKWSITAALFNAKLTEADAKAIIENPAKAWEIPKANLKATDVAHWDAGGAEGGLALSYYNLINTDLGKTAALPTSISMGTHGIKATATNGTSYAQLDYRGLYVNNGAIQITNSSGSTTIDGSGIYAQYIIGTNITTYAWDAQGGTSDYQIMNKQIHQFIEGSTGYVKVAIGFEKQPLTQTNVPAIVLGTGPQGNSYPHGKAFITKDATGLNLFKVNDTNTAANGITISDTTIRCTLPLTLDSTLSQTYLTQSGWVSNLTQKLNSSGNFGVNQSGKRIEITDVINGKNSSGYQTGLYIDPTYSDLFLYYNGGTTPIFKIGNNLAGEIYMNMNGNSMIYNSGGVNYLAGTWNFSTASSITGIYAKYR